MATTAGKKPEKYKKARSATPSKGAVHRKVGVTPAANNPTRKLRDQLELTQPQFARLLPASVRTIAALESGSDPTESIARRLTEIARLTNALAEVIDKASIGEWLREPNPAFDGLKPLEVIERGESDRLWQMIYFLRSGIAF